MIFVLGDIDGLEVSATETDGFGVVYDPQILKDFAKIHTLPPVVAIAGGTLLIPTHTAPKESWARAEIYISVMEEFSRLMGSKLTIKTIEGADKPKNEDMPKDTVY